MFGYMILLIVFPLLVNGTFFIATFGYEEPNMLGYPNSLFSCASVFKFTLQ